MVPMLALPCNAGVLSSIGVQKLRLRSMRGIMFAALSLICTFGNVLVEVRFVVAFAAVALLFHQLFQTLPLLLLLVLLLLLLLPLPLLLLLHLLPLPLFAGLLAWLRCFDACLPRCQQVRKIMGEMGGGGVRKRNQLIRRIMGEMGESVMEIAAASPKATWCHASVPSLP